MIKILTGRCKINVHIENRTEYFSSNTFDCLCRETHEYYATVCTNCCYNLFGFPRNYFESYICWCVNTDKDNACIHCKFLEHTLNSNVKKYVL